MKTFLYETCPATKKTVLVNSSSQQHFVQVQCSPIQWICWLLWKGKRIWRDLGVHQFTGGQYTFAFYKDQCKGRCLNLQTCLSLFGIYHKKQKHAPRVMFSGISVLHYYFFLMHVQIFCLQQTKAWWRQNNDVGLICRNMTWRTCNNWRTNEFQVVSEKNIRDI